MFSVDSPGAALRAALWRVPAGRSRGTALLLHGRTEFIEKYFELASEFLARGYDVATFDWRGQGLSSRACPDPERGHVADFSEFDADLDAALAAFRAKGLAGPSVLFAHSMGGCVALRRLARGGTEFAKAVVTAPMLAVRMPPWARAIAGGLARSQVARGKGMDYVPGGAANDGLAQAFEGNRVTRDPVRYARSNDVIRARPALNLKGPTFGWLDAAIRAMRELSRPGSAARVAIPTLIVSAARDQVVRPGPDVAFATWLARGGCFALADAEHEIVQERDAIRRLFWGAADAFLAD